MLSLWISSEPTTETLLRGISRLPFRPTVPVVCLLLAGVVAILMRLPGLWLPLERDEGAYGLIAAQWLAGSLPYRDVFDHKPPLIYLLYMPALLLGEQVTFTIRLWASLLFLLQLPIVFAIGRHAWNTADAGLATLVYAVAGSAFTLQGLMFNTEQALMLPALGALWALVRAREDARLRWFAFYGLCLGCVTLIKPTAAPLLVPLVMLTGAPSLPGRLQQLAVTCLCAMVPWLPFILYWGAVGALADLIFALVEYNRLYAAESLGRWSTAGIVDILAPFAPLLICAVGGAVSATGAGASRRGTLIVLWTLAFFCAALLSLRPYTHYYYPVLAGLSLLAAPPIIVLARQAHRVSGRWQRLLATSGPLILLALLLVPFALDNLRLIRLDPVEQAAALYGLDGTSYFVPAQEVATIVKAATRPDEPIYVWGSEPEIYLLSGRRTTSRYIFDYPLGLLPRARQMLIAELRRRPPAVIVTYQGFGDEDFVTIAQSQNLSLSTTIGGFDIWTAPGTRIP